MKDRITLFNQVTGPLFIDIANVFSLEYEEVVLVTGSIEPTYARLSSKIKVVKKARYKRTKSYQRIISWLLFFLQSFVYLFFNNNYGRILFVTNPPFMPFLGIFFSKVKVQGFSILVYDIYPEALLNFGYINNKSFLYKLWVKLNKKSYKSANQIITISNVMKKVLSKSANKNKIKVIYPWVDNNYIKPIKKSENWFLKKHNLINKKVILYSGNMGLTHDLITVLKAAKKILKMEREYHFLFIGDGAQKQTLVNFKNNNKLTNVSFLPYQDPEVLPYSFSSADFGIVSLGTGAEGLSIPSKTFYFLSAQVAIIAITESGSEIEGLIKNNDCGICIKPNDEKSLIEFLLNSNEKKINTYKKNSRLLSKKFTIENAKQFL